MLNKQIVTPLLKDNTIIVFNIDALLSLSEYGNMNTLNDSPYHFSLELKHILEKKNPDKIYLWSYDGALAPVISYLQEKYNYNPEHTYWEPNPINLLDYIRDTEFISESNIAFVDYKANRKLPYYDVLLNTQYANIDPLDFLQESESRRYKETKKYISCYARAFRTAYISLYGSN